MLGGEESKIIAFGGNKMSKDTKVSLGNDGKSSVAPAEEVHMGEDCISDQEGHKGSGATRGDAPQKPS